MNSKFEISKRELHAKLLSGGQDGATHNRLGAAGLEGTGGTCRGTGGQRRSQDDTQTTSAARLDAAAEPGQASRHGPGHSAGGRRRGLAGLVQATQVLPVWRAPECPKGPAAAPVGGGGARTTHRQQAPPDWRPPRSLARLQDTGLAAVRVGGGRAWPDNESTRRAKLAARTTRGRAAAHRHTQRPGPSRQATRRPEIWRGNEHRRKSGDATSPRRTEKPQNSS